MKILPSLLILPFIACLPLHAQNSTNEPGGSEKNHPPAENRGPMGQLTKEERMQLKAAHDKAIQQDPTLETKMEEARKAMRDAMIQADPTVEPILDKIAPRKKDVLLDGVPRKHHEGGANQPPEAGPSTNQSQSTNEMSGPWRHDGHGRQGMANLTESEREQVKALHEQVKQDPSVVSAHEAMESASTPEERHAAEETFRKAVHDAMIKADPSIEPILEKLHPQGAPPPPPKAP